MVLLRRAGTGYNRDPTGARVVGIDNVSARVSRRGLRRSVGLIERPSPNSVRSPRLPGRSGIEAFEVYDRYPPPGCLGRYPRL